MLMALTVPSMSALCRSRSFFSGHQASAMRHLSVTEGLHRFMMECMALYFPTRTCREPKHTSQCILCPTGSYCIFELERMLHRTRHIFFLFCERKTRETGFNFEPTDTVPSTLAEQTHTETKAAGGNSQFETKPGRGK